MMTNGHASLPATPASPFKEGRALWSITGKLEGRTSEGKEALDSLHDNAMEYMHSCFNTAKRRLTEDSSLCERSPQRKGTTAPENTPTSATGSDWSIKKQRRSVAEAEQMALVKAKVALFESYRSATTHKHSSPSTIVSDPVSAIAITPKKSIRLTPSKSASDSPSTTSYHAVFPGLNLGETMTLASTSARSFQISVSRIPEEAEDEGAGEETSREGRGAAGATFNAGKPFRGALRESPRLRQSLQPSLGLPAHHAPKTLEAARGGPGPGGAGGRTTPDQPLTAHHITRAMKGLQLTEIPESSSIEPGKGSDKGKLGEGGEGGGLIETGPAPIIECNGSGVHPLEGTRPASHCGSGAGGVGGFLGIVQKTLGLSWQCAALPPTHTSAINTMASSTSPPLEPLPPLDPADTYPMSDSDEEGRPLGEEDVVGSDEEAWDRRRRSAKKIPDWARGTTLAAALDRQFTTDPATWVDPDTIFPEVPPTCNLEEIFKVRKKRYYKRTSSGMWEKDGLTPVERMTYRRAMACERKGEEVSVNGGNSSRVGVSNISIVGKKE